MKEVKQKAQKKEQKIEIMCECLVVTNEVFLLYRLNTEYTGRP